jgi:hypothetical protein
MNYLIASRNLSMVANVDSLKLMVPVSSLHGTLKIFR